MVNGDDHRWCSCVSSGRHHLAPVFAAVGAQPVRTVHRMTEQQAGAGAGRKMDPVGSLSQYACTYIYTHSISLYVSTY